MRESQFRNFLLSAADKMLGALGWVTPLLDLGLRIWVTQAFFKSGLGKFQGWDTTLWLFENEYQVPLLPPEFAAYLATAAELVLPVLLFVGLGSRISALMLFILNYVAVISYPGLGAAGVKDHVLWGTMLTVTFLHGPGPLSIDHWLRRRYLSHD